MRFFLLTATLVVSACAMPTGPNTTLDGYYNAVGRPRHLRQPIHLFRAPALAIPSNSGFLYRQPIGWEGNNPRSFRLENQTENFHGRCWLDGREVMPTAYGAIPRGPVATKSGVKLVPLLPPGASAHFILPDAGHHHLRCQLYAGPAPFVLVYEATDAEFRPDRYASQIYRLSPDYMGRVSRIAEN